MIIGQCVCRKGSFEEKVLLFSLSAFKELIMCRGSVYIVCLYQNHCGGSQMVIELAA